MEENKHELEKVNWGVIPIAIYRGCLVTKMIGKGYQIWGQMFSTPQEIDEAIDKASSILNESVVNVPNNGNMETQNTQ